jgi:protein phosphatase
MGTDRNAETAILPSPSLDGETTVLPRGAPLRVDFGAMTHPGKVRPNNEDHYLVFRISRALSVLKTNLAAGELPDRVEEAGYAMVVADGMGGLAAGEHASRLAIRTAVNLVLESRTWSLRIDEEEAQKLVEKMVDYFRTVDQVLIENGRGGEGLAGMGTTLTVAYSVGPQVFIAHAGDSRVYLYRGKALSQLTHDHTLAQLLADTGEVDAMHIPTNLRRHVLTNFAGGSTSGIVPEIDTLTLKDGDRLLLCSDGLTEMVDDSTIGQILARHPEPQAACRALVDQALKRGGRDNVTVVIARYGIPPARA